MAHAYYRQPGGEDLSFASERDLLRSAGHEVLTYTVDNEDLERMSPVRAAGKTIWNRQIARELSQLVERMRPEVVHFQNTFPTLSPAVFAAVSGKGVAVVESLRNFRVTCANGMFFRDGQICELCLGRTFPIHGVRYACYRDDRRASLVVGTMIASHHAVGTWRRAVDRYIVLTDLAFAKLRTVLPEELLTVKSNFVYPDPGPGSGAGSYVAFAGRLSPEKGIATLLEAWRSAGELPELRIMGSGPLEDAVRDAAAVVPRVRYLGQVSPERVRKEVGDASALVFPSECYEGQPRVLLESFALGTPVVAAGVGAGLDLVGDGATGRTFAPGRPDGLVRVTQELLADRAALGALRVSTRRIFAERFTAERNLQRLLAIYGEAIAARRVRTQGSSTA